MAMGLTGWALGGAPGAGAGEGGGGRGGGGGGTGGGGVWPGRGHDGAASCAPTAASRHRRGTLTVLPFYDRRSDYVLARHAPLNHLCHAESASGDRSIP